MNNINNDLISRQMAIDAFTCKGSIFTYGANECKTIVSRIMTLPSAQPERKTGRWIPSDSELEIKCNKCGKDFSEYVDSIDYIYLAEYPKFCPNCGAIMKEGE